MWAPVNLKMKLLWAGPGQRGQVRGRCGANIIGLKPDPYFILFEASFNNVNDFGFEYRYCYIFNWEF